MQIQVFSRKPLIAHRHAAKITSAGNLGEVRHTNIFLYLMSQILQEIQPNLMNSSREVRVNKGYLARKKK